LARWVQLIGSTNLLITGLSLARQHFWGLTDQQLKNRISETVIKADDHLSNEKVITATFGDPYFLQVVAFLPVKIAWFSAGPPYNEGMIR